MATLSSAFEEINATAQSLHAERRNHAQRASPSTCGNTVLTSDSKDRKVVMHHFNDNELYGKRTGTTDNGGVSAVAAGYAGGAQGRHDDDEAGRLADDEAGLSVPVNRDCGVSQRAKMNDFLLNFCEICKTYDTAKVCITVKRKIFYGY